MERSIRSVLGICIACVMTVIIGIASIVGISSVNDSYSDAYNHYRESLDSMAKIQEYIQRFNAIPYMALEAEGEETHKSIPVLQENIDRINDFELYLYSFDASIVNPEVRALFDEVKAVYNNEYMPALLQMQERAHTGVEIEYLRELVDPMENALNKMADNCAVCMEIVSYTAEEAGYSGEATARTIILVIVSLIVIEIILSVIFIVLSITVRRFQGAGSSNAYPKINGKFPVYAMYPADPSNPVTPPNATHIMYPIIYPFDPSQIK